MTRKKRATPTGSPLHNNAGINSNKAHAQELRLLAFLTHCHGGINRYEAERALAICHLAGRIKGLKYSGCEFTRRSEVAVDAYGQARQGIARYWLKSAPAHLLRAANDEGATP